MFPTASNPVGPIDELEIDCVPTMMSGDDEGADTNDDATEISQRSGYPLAPSPTAGPIRMEGWLNHTTSSHKNHGGAENGADNPAGGGAAPPPPQQQPSSSSSIISKTVSKKKRQATGRKKKQPRYFVLRGSTLSYYSRRHDVKAKGTFVFTRGCDVGPVVYCSLDEKLSSGAVVTESQQHPPGGEASLFLSSPSSGLARDGAGGASVSTSTVTEHASGNAVAKSSAKSRKKGMQYCVQVTWHTNDRPSKDETIVAQAKAQVAAESENEALIEQRRQREEMAMEVQNVEHSLEDYAANGNGNGNDDRDRDRGRSNGSPTSSRAKLLRRVKSESITPRLTPRRGSAREQIVHRQSLDGLPLELTPPNLDTDDENNGEPDGIGAGRTTSLPRPKIALAAGMHTPASALAGVNVFHNKPVGDGDGAEGRAGGDDENQTMTETSSFIGHETGLHKHYTQQIEKHTRDQKKTEAELAKVMQLLSMKASHRKAKKRLLQGTKVAAVSTAAITAGVLTAGIGLAAGLVFVGVTAAAGGSGAVMGSKVLDKARGKYNKRESQKSFCLIIAAETYEEATRWRAEILRVVRDLADGGAGEQDGGGGDIAAKSSAVIVAPLTPKRSISSNSAGRNIPNIPTDGGGGAANYSENAYHDLTPKWVPIQGGGIALWGILGALGGGGGNLRIYREERSPHLDLSSPWPLSEPPTSSFPTMPRFRSDVGLVGQPFPPFKASIVLKANSLDAFMCLMCSGRIHGDEQRSGGVVGGERRVPVPNSGQIASFRIIETMDDHMDVVHLVFRPLYLFPSWTAPRDFVLYRFWKYDDDGTYQVCFDSGQHRDCPPVKGYVRGGMHGVYTIAPLKRRTQRGASTAPGGGGGGGSSNHPNLMKEECLLSHVVQIDPRGWVPTTSSLPFFRNQGYGDAFAVMALHQMLDVKEALDSARFVAVPMDGTQGAADASRGGQRGFRRRVSERVGGAPGRMSRASGRSVGGVQRSSRGPLTGGSQQQQRERNQLYIPTLALNRTVSEDVSDDEEPDSADYDFKYSGRELFSADGYHQSPPPSSSVNGNGSRDVLSDRTDPLQPDDKTGGDTVTASRISTIPPPMIHKWWAEPDANSFRVRGKTYKTDNKKVNAGSSLFRLLATDIVETDIPIMTGMCLHPKERFQMALQRDREAKAKGINSCETPPFVFVVNIALPGPPNYHIVFYYAVDKLSLIDGTDGTPSSKLCQEFFFGKDDAFRDNTFKLIPQIIEGNFMVRKAVGSTPAIMGNKIKQTYIQGERFFELMIDTGSSAVAAGVIRICNGYAKMIVVDLAFLFEGYNEDTLPERVLGCARLKNAEFGKQLRFVESVDD